MFHRNFLKIRSGYQKGKNYLQVCSAPKMGVPESLNRYGQGIIVWKFSQQKLIVMTNPGYDNAEWLYKSLDAFYAVLNKCGNVYGNGTVLL